MSGSLLDRLTYDCTEIPSAVPNVSLSACSPVASGRSHTTLVHREGYSCQVSSQYVVSSLTLHMDLSTRFVMKPFRIAAFFLTGGRCRDALG